jgi:hypothetical protein
MHHNVQMQQGRIIVAASAELKIVYFYPPKLFTP